MSGFLGLWREDWKGKRSEWLMISARVMKYSRIDWGDVYAQPHEFPKNHWLGHFEWVNCTGCELYLNKALILKKEEMGVVQGDSLINSQLTGWGLWAGCTGWFATSWNPWTLIFPWVLPISRQALEHVILLIRKHKLTSYKNHWSMSFFFFPVTFSCFLCMFYHSMWRWLWSLIAIKPYQTMGNI